MNRLLMEIIDKFKDNWDWSWLSRNPNITFDHVLQYPEKPWDWLCLSRNRNITLDHVLENP